jgi:hypothetical protein
MSDLQEEMRAIIKHEQTAAREAAQRETTLWEELTGIQGLLSVDQGQLKEA